MYRQWFVHRATVIMLFPKHLIYLNSNTGTLCTSLSCFCNFWFLGIHSRGAEGSKRASARMSNFDALLYITRACKDESIAARALYT